MFNDDGLPGPSAGRGGGVRRSYANKLLCDRSGRRPNAKVFKAVFVVLLIWTVMYLGGVHRKLAPESSKRDDQVGLHVALGGPTEAAAAAGEPRATPQPGFTGGTAVPSLLLAPVGSKADPAGLAGAATGPPEAPLTAREQEAVATEVVREEHGLEEKIEQEIKTEIKNAEKNIERDMDRQVSGAEEMMLAFSVVGAVVLMSWLYTRRLAANKRLQLAAQGGGAYGERGGRWAAPGPPETSGPPVIMAQAGSGLSEEEELALEIGMLLLQEKQAAKAMSVATRRVEEHLSRGVFIPLTFAAEKEPPPSPLRDQTVLLL